MSSQLYSRRRFYQSYWMVNEVQNYGNLSSESTSKCGDEGNNILSSLVPVYSKMTGKIYRNSVCAKAANITDGVLWDVVFVCTYLSRTTEVSSISSHLYLTSLPDVCRVEFKYPGNISDIKSEKCFTGLIETCPKVQFSVPENLKLTKYQIRQACTSGLVSPYIVKDMYLNVFCHICNGQQYSEIETC